MKRRAQIYSWSWRAASNKILYYSFYFFIPDAQNFIDHQKFPFKMKFLFDNGRARSTEREKSLCANIKTTASKIFYRGMQTTIQKECRIKGERLTWEHHQFFTESHCKFLLLLTDEIFAVDSRKVFLLVHFCDLKHFRNILLKCRKFTDFSRSADN